MSKIVFTLFAVGISMTLYSQQEQKQDSTNESAIVVDEQAEKYLATFEKDGVPTRGALEAAVTKAKKENTIESWGNAAKLANSYSNVVNLLSDHYLSKIKAADSDVGRRMVAQIYGDKLRDYASTQETYIKVRNDCYLSIAELYLKQGNKARALSYAMTDVRLTGASEDITRGEQLIKTIIEYSSLPKP